VDFTQTNEQIQGYLAGLINEALKILNTKKPKPAKKEEPKKEDTTEAKKEDSDDVAPETPTETPTAA